MPQYDDDEERKNDLASAIGIAVAVFLSGFIWALIGFVLWRVLRS
jgi:hypothetical protein